MTDVSLFIFPVEVQKSGFRLIDDRQRPIDRRQRPSGVQNRPFLGVFSATQPRKGNRVIETYGAGDGNRTHVRSLGSFYTAIVRRPLVVSDCTQKLILRIGVN